ncbi:MAG: hypothetical protein JNM93_12310 [Bacteriovoracaceae bacterium]|nr:hypothetical protein [Bacteriovoracaceae bacterium]
MLTIFKLLFGITSLWSSENICTGVTYQTINSKESYCRESDEQSMQRLCSFENTMGFENAGGLFGLPTGVCWWHSEFMRNATYLTYYRNECPRWDETTRDGRKKIRQALNDLIFNREVVVIPGYDNLLQFTSDPYVQAKLQKKLQQWMGRDSFLYFQWVNGLEGVAYRPGNERAIKREYKNLRQLYHEVINEKKISYVMVQHTGVEAHAYLVFHVERWNVEGEDHYEIFVQDSNYQNFSYNVGGTRMRLATPYNKYTWNGEFWMQSSDYRAGYSKPLDFNLYVQKSRDLKKTERVRTRYCARAPASSPCP